MTDDAEQFKDGDMVYIPQLSESGQIIASQTFLRALSLHCVERITEGPPKLIHKDWFSANQLGLVT